MLATWEEEADVVKQSDVKARIGGVAAKMKKFHFLFCLMLAERLLKHCDNLSKTMQSTAIPAVEARRLSELCVAVLQKMRGDAEFDLFWSLVVQTQSSYTLRIRLYSNKGNDQVGMKMVVRSIVFSPTVVL